MPIDSGCAQSFVLRSNTYFECKNVPMELNTDVMLFVDNVNTVNQSNAVIIANTSVGTTAIHNRIISKHYNVL